MDLGLQFSGMNPAGMNSAGTNPAGMDTAGMNAPIAGMPVAGRVTAAVPGTPASDNVMLRPLADRMRPKRLDDVIGQDQVLAPGAPLRLMASPTTSQSVVVPGAALLYGPPGTGKTTIAHLIAEESHRRFIELSAVNARVEELRSSLSAAERLKRRGEETVLFIDEIHRYSREEQDILLPAVEKRLVTFVAATTEAPSSTLAPALLSRCIIVHLHQLGVDGLNRIVDRAVASPDGLGGSVTLDPEARKLLVLSSGGDARHALTTLEAAASRAASQATPGQVAVVTSDDVRSVIDNIPSYSVDDHYDMASALVKSMRGSNPDAAVYWATRMLDAGEDPMFIARRVVVSAAQDVGLAQPQVLQTAVAAAQAVEMVGMPDARVPLMEAIIQIAVSPKSDAVLNAANAAQKDIKDGKLGIVPLHLRNPTDADHRAAGNGMGYINPLEHGGFVAQQYMPMGIEDTEYYQPRNSGVEAKIGPWLAQYRAAMRNASGPADEGETGTSEADAVN
ncbi:replication-associated recombination protein A [Bifidobacterium thermophilum]|uniref:replication-associated recombination protein A n=1 Tax=Bifidobacterium thermophilum TaxID=33905 RepID=UPI003991FD76